MEEKIEPNYMPERPAEVPWLQAMQDHASRMKFNPANDKPEQGAAWTTGWSAPAIRAWWAAHNAATQPELSELAVVFDD